MCQQQLFAQSRTAQDPLVQGVNHSATHTMPDCVVMAPWMREDRYGAQNVLWKDVLPNAHKRASVIFITRNARVCVASQIATNLSMVTAYVRLMVSAYARVVIRLPTYLSRSEHRMDQEHYGPMVTAISAESLNIALSWRHTWADSFYPPKPSITSMAVDPITESRTWNCGPRGIREGRVSLIKWSGLLSFFNSTPRSV